ncbi:hypothetical protein [Longivirga aurantiaca]|uniref:Aminoglycoside phosphotransferase domain-containing protein n=1 Tax=Longivirga aurantiaca TaxID=1837743 RepID=A0ABW1SW06_9ACTN
MPQAASAVRPTWDGLPAEVRHAIEECAGSSVRQAVSQGGGFTSGFASRLELEDGRRLFVKAATSEQHVFARPSYERESAVVRGLPAAVPAPRVLWTRDLGAWFVAAFEDVEGRHPLRPWDPSELSAVVDLCVLLADELTPVPEALPAPHPLTEWDDDFSFWRRRSSGDQAALAVPLAEGWAPLVGDLAAAEASWTVRCAGTTGLHFDLRDDNLLVRPDGSVVVCDWNHLTLGAAWLDLAALLVSVHGDGLDADTLWAASPLTDGVDEDALVAFLAAVAGFFVDVAAQEEVPGSPYLREHQAWWRDASLSWLDSRLQG